MGMDFSGRFQLAAGFLLVILSVSLLASAEIQGEAPAGQPIPKLSIISPLHSQEISGSGIVIAVIEPRDSNALSAGFDINGLLAGSLSAENNFFSDFNSLLLEDGNYSLSVNACILGECISESVPIEIRNNGAVVPSAVAEQPPEVLPEEKVLVKASNIPSTLTLYDLNGSVSASGMEYVEIKPSSYNARIDFFDSTLSSIILDSVIIDSNALLVEVDESIDSNAIGLPGINAEWLKIIAVKPNSEFSKGIIRLNVPSGADALFKCKDWAFEGKKCPGAWEKIQEINGETILEIPISQSDPAFGFAKKNKISFGRQLNCHKCGQHKVPPTTNVEVQITATTQQPLGNAALADFFPASWILIDAQGGNVSDWNSKFKKIEWTVDLQDSVSKTYTLQSPERTLPPTEYHFFSQLNEFYSDYWRVVVADPQSTNVIRFRNISELTPSEPMPNDAISGDSFIAGPTESLYGMNETVGTTSTGVHKVTGSTSVGYFKAINFTSPPLAAQTIAAGTWTIYVWGRENASTADISLRASIWAWADSNDSMKGPIVGTPVDSSEFTATLAAKTISLNGSQITLNSKDKIVVEIDLSVDGAKYVTDWADINFGNITYDSNVKAPQAINFYSQLRQPVISIPPSDNNSGINQYSNFLVQGITVCDGNYYDCGTVDTNLQWCAGAGCSNWLDMNASAGPIRIITGSNPQTTNLTSGSSATSTWTVSANIADTYELRIIADGNNTDSNNSSGTDRTIVIQTPINDYTFSLAYPSSGCTDGKGRFAGQGSGACQKGYFVTTDLSGPASQTKVDPEGQTAATPFFVYNNQSSAHNDINFTLDLNALLPATLKMKVSKSYAGWVASCSGNTDVDCVELTATSQNIGKAVYSAGAADLNIFIWADFVSAGVGSTDRNVTSTSVPS